MKQLCGKATKVPVEVNWFHWKGYSESHIHELEAWVEANGENFKDKIDLSQGLPRILVLGGISYSLFTDHVIVKDEYGVYFLMKLKDFHNNYNIVSDGVYCG